MQKSTRPYIPCKYFNRTKRCRRESTCWFYHDENHKAEKKSNRLKLYNNKKFKVNVDKESKQDQGANLNQEIIELLKLLLRKNNI